MRKFVFTIICIVLALALLAACAPARDQGGPQNETPQQGVHPYTLKAVIESAVDGHLLVQPLEGLDQIDVIYLNRGDDTVMNVSPDAPLEPGTIVYATIADAIMESYPPQVHLIELIKTEIDETIEWQPIIDVPAADGSAGSSALMPDEYVVGRVTHISGEEYLIDVLEANLYEGEITLTIPAHVMDENTIIDLGYTISVYIAAQGAQYTVEKIVSVEEGVLRGIDEGPPEDDMVMLDDRETVSAYLGGMFPNAVYDMDDDTITAQAGLPFAIALEENCESYWELQAQSGVVLEADGSDEPREDGFYNHYFGIRIDELGSYTLEFVLYAPDGETSLVFDVTVE